jgi:large subunit ribosomal protein L21
MYAVIRTGGKQYRVEQGDTVKIEKIAGDPGEAITFDDVLLLGDEESTQVGDPNVAGATVSGRIVEQARHKKLIVFKFRRRQNSKTKNGHRQHFTRVAIDSISLA